MKNFLIAFVVFLVWSFFGLWIYSWLQPEKNSPTQNTEIAENNHSDPSVLKDQSSAKIDSIPIQDSSKDNLTENNNVINEEKDSYEGLKATTNNGDIVFLFSEGISIKKNTLDVFIPQSSIDYKYKINTYLIEHPNQEVHINSIYSPKESVLTPNLGVQRANIILKQLIVTGVPKEKIVIRSIIKDILFNTDGSYTNSINFTFGPLDINRIEIIKKSSPERKIVYPKFSGSQVLVNNNLELLLSELIEYFKNHPNKKIEIVGHTDNIGTGNDNYLVGLKYSRAVRLYLVKKGDISRAQIKATSKGEAEPIDDNNTIRGRKANRRIEVIFN